MIWRRVLGDPCFLLLPWAIGGSVRGAVVDVGALRLNTGNVPYRLVQETCHLDSLTSIKFLDFVRKKTPSKPYASSRPKPHPHGQPSNAQAAASKPAGDPERSPANEWLASVGMIGGLSVVYEGSSLEQKGVDGTSGTNVGVDELEFLSKFAMRRISVLVQEAQGLVELVGY